MARRKKIILNLSKTNYAEVVSQTIMGGISSRSNGLSKATSHHVNKMAAQAKKRITNAFKHNKNSIGTLAKEFKKTAKYHFKNTTMLVYAPMLNDAYGTIYDTTMDSIDNLLKGSMSLGASFLNNHNGGFV